MHFDSYLIDLDMAEVTRSFNQILLNLLAMLAGAITPTGDGALVEVESSDNSLYRTAMRQQRDEIQRRQNFLTFFLVGFGALFFLFVMILLTGGFFFYVASVLFGMVLVGLFHYVVWGMSFEQQVAGEAEEEQLRQRAAEIAEEDGWNYPDPRTDIQR